MGLLKLPNFYAYGLLAFVVVMIVAGIYTAGQRAERNKQAAEIAKTNAVIVEARGKDEAEIAAQDKAAETVDAAVKAKIKQTLILDGETATWLEMVK